ncbi:MAG TPA: zinc ribbon domain-containing protein [Anaerolineales bacterium]|nr:zinc ribbon domain-containing protein [Anaerolineales bacterium]
MENCSSCKEILTERGYHCPSCGIQVKCKSCEELLNANARFCAQCGTAIGQSVLATSDQNGHALNGTFNIIEVDRDSRSSRFRARVTDHAIDSLSHPLTIYLAGQTGLSVKRREPISTQPTVHDQPLLVGLRPDESDGGGSPAENAYQEDQVHSTPADLEAQRLRELFREREGKLRLDEPQLRASGTRLCATLDLSLPLRKRESR